MTQRKRAVPIFWPAYDGADVQAAMADLFPADMSNRWLGQAHRVDEFEALFSKKFGYRYSVSVSSGTAALELAYHLIGIGEGDEVITPVLTCTATNIPLVRLKATIVFADIKDDFTISPEDVEKRITKKTKAIVAVTLGGIPIDSRIPAIAKRYGIPLVIDAAQSVGVGEKYGDYICYSFQAIKNFTTGDGGMIVLRNKKEYARAKKLRWFGIDREAKIRANWQPYKRRQMTMDIDEPGYKFHMNDIAASIGIVGLKHSDEYLRHRKKIAMYYDTHLDRLKYTPVSGGTYWLYGILTKNRDQVAEKAGEAGIETNMVHLRNDIFKVFGGKRLPLPTMKRLEKEYLYIPINTRMSVDDAHYVVRVLNAA
ncbi:DegT/DnrJ/EryC1/StrS family aminotransferase [Candidatus Kaiserbacteria bacterium]|nr:DegT/DnrJ/EryC1/StrS family aminotransferase [Candidatus Kaiserbacteria bacterium]